MSHQLKQFEVGTVFLDCSPVYGNFIAQISMRTEKQGLFVTALTGNHLYTRGDRVARHESYSHFIVLGDTAWAVKYLKGL